MEKAFGRNRGVIIKNAKKVTLGISESDNTIIDLGGRCRYYDNGSKIVVENIDKRIPGEIKIWKAKDVLVILKNCTEVVSW